MEPEKQYFYGIPQQYWDYLEQEKTITSFKHQYFQEKNENNKKTGEDRKDDKYFQSRLEEIQTMYEANRKQLLQFLRGFLTEYLQSQSTKIIEFPPVNDSEIRNIIIKALEEVKLNYEVEGKNQNGRISASRTKLPDGEENQQESSKKSTDSSNTTGKITQTPSVLVDNSENKSEEGNSKVIKKPQSVSVKSMGEFAKGFKDTPDPITHVSFEKFANGRLDLSFPAPDENGYPIKEYVLYIYNPTNNLWFEHLRSEVSKFTLKELKPNMTYLIRIGAVNQLGESELEKIFKFKTPEFFFGSAMMSGSNSWEDFNPEVFANPKLKESPDFVEKFELMKYNTRIIDLVPALSKIALLDDGSVLQWGLTFIMDEGTDGQQQNQSKENQVSKESLMNEENTPDNVSRIPSSPFYVFNSAIPQAKEVITAISAGANFCLALSISGQVYSWGLNFVGQLGHGDCLPKCDPKRIETISKMFVKEISACRFNAAALTGEGKVYTWGERQSGLGAGPIRNRFEDVIGFEDPLLICDTPREILELSAYEKITKISVGSAFNAAINDKGELFTWGDNLKGQLGHGLVEERKLTFINVPRKVEKFVEGKVVVKEVACGDQHVLAIVETDSKTENVHEVWSWGYNRQGQCGHGDRETKSVPTKINSIPEEVDKISAGNKHSLLAGKSGQIYVCGRWDSIPKKFSNGKADREKPTALSSQLFSFKDVAPDAKVLKLRASRSNSAVILG